ncbi:MAG TPA: invasion associated locus B family protein [Methylocystis sp.]|nr:invasion associated locus B family protein [Methylocystis sp.]
MSRIRKGLLAAATLLASGAASAQQPAPAPAAGQGQPQGPISVDLVGVEQDWVKVCGQADPQTTACYTVRDFGPKADQPIMAFQVFDQKGATDKLVRVLLPLGLQLKPGFRISVDSSPFESGGYEVCFQAGCFAEAKLKSSLVDSMKKGQQVTLVVKNAGGAEVTLKVPLAGFGKAYDGPATDPKVLEEQQKKLQAELEKKAAEMRKQQLPQQAAPTAPAPAPASPAPARK